MRNKKSFITIEVAAQRLKVKQLDIKNWISNGKLVGRTFYWKKYVTLESVQDFGRKMSSELLDAINKNFFDEIIKIKPKVQRDLNQHIHDNMNDELHELKEIVGFLQNMHNKYEKEFDINIRNGISAAIIMFARVITLMNSLIKDIESDNYTGAAVTFRPLFEAILLTNFFSLAAKDVKQVRKIEAWFTKGRPIGDKSIWNYLAYECNIGLTKEQKDIYKNSMDDLLDIYSVILHHDYTTIIKTYKTNNLSGLTSQRLEKREGFDYNFASNAVDMIEIFQTAQHIVFQTLCCFSVSFQIFPLTDNEWKQFDIYKKKLEHIFMDKDSD